MRSVFKRILKWVIRSFRSECLAVPGGQHGFLSHLSCLSNLMILEEMIIPSMDDGDTATVGDYIFSKAFDLVNHGLFSAKLESFGLCEKNIPMDQVLYDGKTMQTASHAGASYWSQTLLTTWAFSWTIVIVIIDGPSIEQKTNCNGHCH